MKQLLWIFLIVLIGNASAQNTYTLNIHQTDTTSVNPLKHIQYKKSFPDKTTLNEQLSTLLFTLYESGYLAARFDSISYDSTHAHAYLYIGKKFKLISLSKGNIDDLALHEMRYRERFYRNKPFRNKEVSRLCNRVITYYENNGYPFANVCLDSIRISNDSINASLLIKKQQLIKIDSILIKGNAKISKAYLYNYLSIKPNGLYNESYVSKISSRLKELPFLYETKPMLIGFTEEKAKLLIYADKRKASQFDGILGVAPNNTTSGKLLLTGEVNLKLLNSFGQGELLSLNWKSLQKNTQDLKLHVNYPYVFSTPFGVDYSLSLYKKDTLYISVEHIIGIQYNFKGNNYLKAFYDNAQSSLLSTKGLEYFTVLPAYADFSTNLYGIESFIQKLDYILNPRAGYEIKLSGAVGDKEIKKNNKINSTLYDSIQLTSTQYKLLLNVSYYVPIFKKATLLFSSNNGYLNNADLFENELFRIGGLRSLRGFDEESILASSYSIFTLEYRYLFEQNSNISLFFNQAYYEKKLHNSFICNRPMGFGAGLTFQTKAGIFSVYYALGKESEQAINFKSAKIHFGYIASF